MTHIFDIPFEGDAESTLLKARKAIEFGKGTLTGDNSTGSFAIPAGLSKIKGNYVVETNKLKIEITNKPIYVSISMIEGILKHQLDS